MNAVDTALLESAAKAVGIVIEWWDDDGWMTPGHGEGDDWRIWNPLADGNDALRLAVYLNIDILMRQGSKETWAQAPMRRTIMQSWGGDRYAATRRAIVRAAADLAEARND